MNYEYSIKILSPGTRFPTLKNSEVVIGTAGDIRILTVENEAFSISRELTKREVKFTINPVSLDDIFFYLLSRKGEKRFVQREELGAEKT